MKLCTKQFSAILFSVFVLQGQWALAEEGDAFGINASISTLWDSNLFRLAPTVDPKTLGLNGKSDTVTSTMVGVSFNKMYSLQQIIANFSVVDNRYRENGYLDYRALNYDAEWLWAIDKQWTGEASLDRTETLNSFTDNSSYTVRSTRVTENQNLTAYYWFHSNWAALAGVSHDKVTNEQVFLEDSDYSAMGYHVGVRYKPRSGNTVTFRAKRTGATYNKRPFNPVAQYDNGFTQDGYETNVDWQLDGFSRILARVEYVSRKHDHFSARDYSGVTGNLEYRYAFGAKLTGIIRYQHSLSSYQQSTSSYYVEDLPSVAVQWDVTSKISAMASFGVGQRTYHGEITPLPPGNSQREDKFTKVNLNVTYHAARWVDVKASVGQENRNVNNSALDYKDHYGMLSATLRF